MLPAGFLIGILRSRLARGAVADLAVELGRGVSLGNLRVVMAKALRDPSLELAFQAPSGSGYVDGAGQPIDLPDVGSVDRAVTPIEREGETVAVLIHDPGLEAETPGLVGAAGSVAALALQNERLSAQVRAQLEEVRASRARIVEAGDTERRRIERDLHDGAQQRLVALALRLQTARATTPGASELLDQATAELQAAVAEVRDIGRGLHPPILTERGLAAALEVLAERAATPVRITASDERYPASVEAAAYFVAAEALTNVDRYAAAREATVTVTADPHTRDRDQRRRLRRGGSGPGLRTAGPGRPRRGSWWRAHCLEPAGWRHHGACLDPAGVSDGPAPIRSSSRTTPSSCARPWPMRSPRADSRWSARPATSPGCSTSSRSTGRMSRSSMSGCRPLTPLRAWKRRRIRREHPEVAILVLSQYVETRYALELLRADPSGLGYVLKDRISRVADLADAVRRVSEGGSVIDPEVVARLLGRPRTHTRPRRAHAARARDPGAHGRGPLEPGHRRRSSLDRKTVEGHVTRIFSKLSLEPAYEDHRRVLAVLTFLRSD